ncbi:MAG: hypothetical protein DCC75_06150 [Proteobacteria bacterium]|nr:MAG: hypothetical protein DCC75_06150 [Pseudomonadota bacterium]
MPKPKKSGKKRKRGSPSRRAAPASKRKRRSSRKFSFSRLLLIASAIGFAALLAAFLIIDRRVSKYLLSSRPESSPVVYSDAYWINGRLPISAASLVEQLKARNYVLTSSPSSSGEFSQKGDSFKILTREFRGADGSVSKPLKVSLDLASRSIEIDGHAKTTRFALEPQVVATLGQSNVRIANRRSLSDFPAYLLDAVLAIEDERFYTHFGIDLWGIARAMLENIKAMRWAQGGSTITQQLAKNVFFSPKRKLSRKIMEALAALSLERQLPKQRILELYMNEVYLGQEGLVAIHGFPQAAKSFFGKDLSELTLAESATLAGMVQAPSLLSPRRYPKRTLARRNLVLERMYQLGKIALEEIGPAKLETLRVIPSTFINRRSPHFTVSLQKELANFIDLDAALRAGVKIYTGLDLHLQGCAERAVTHGLEELDRRYPRLRRQAGKLEAGLVALEPFSGKVKAWVGGRDYAANQFDHVSQGVRQIGSTIKPFLYLAGLDPSINRKWPLTPITVLHDEPISITLPSKQKWSPENFDKKFRGDVTLRYALEQSLNIPAVEAATKMGLGPFVELLKKLEIASKVSAVPSLALGALDTTPLQLTAGFGAIANGGLYVKPRMFVSIMDDAGGINITSPIVERKVAGPAASYVLTNIMQGVIERGTGKGVRKLGFSGQAAGKTGTSNDERDAWFVGFTPALAAGVWVGFDDNRRVGLTGGAAAVPIWTEFMQCASNALPAYEFIPPRDVAFLNVDSSTGELASPSCPEESLVKEVFIASSAPKRVCRVHGRGAVYAPQIEEHEQRENKREKGFWEGLFG